MSDPSAAIAASSLVADVAPYALALLPVAIGWLAREISKYTKVKFSQAQLVKLDTFAKAEAGALIAASTTNLAGVSIPVRSPIIAAAAARILDAAPKILAGLDLSPSAVATMVAGHVGALQASAPAPAVAVSTPPIKEVSPSVPTAAGPFAEF